MAANIRNGEVNISGDDISGSSGGFSAAYAIAHKYAHSVQYTLGPYAVNPDVPVEQCELQAECLAGV